VNRQNSQLSENELELLATLRALDRKYGQEKVTEGLIELLIRFLKLAGIEYDAVGEEAR